VPAAGASIEKEVNGELFWWCNGSDGKHHKPMFCRHRPTDCKQQLSQLKLETLPVTEQKSSTGGNTVNGSTTTASQSGPKFKLNNNLATALAALDKVLQTSANSNDEAEQDFI
jgi:hypothetical protein